VGTLLLAVGTGAVGATGVLFSSCLRLRSPVGFLLAAYLFSSSEIVAGSLLLSTERWLTRNALLGVIGVCFGVAVLVWATLGRPRPPLTVSFLHSFASNFRDPILALLGGLTVVSQLYLLAVSLTVPQSVTDTMLYHLPRSALWKQQHAVSYVANVPEVAVNVFPPYAEIETAATMILSDRDRFVGMVQLVAVAFACIAIAGVARRLGFDRRAAVFAALAFSTFTVVMLQTPTALNDLVVASFLIACAYFAIGTSRIDLVLAALALALALGTKLTTVFALPALALVVFGSQPRRRWLSVALYGAAGIALGSIWLLVNLVETGRLDGGVGVAPENQALVGRILRSVADLLEMSDAEGKGLLVSPLWGVPALLLALVGAAALCSRKRWRAGALVGLAGVFAFVSLPLLVTWTQVAEHAARHARVAIGFGGGVAGPRLPEGFYESPMHSSYGLAFVLLFLGSGTIVVKDLARRRSSFAVLAALSGVPLTLLIAAIAIGFDPQHLRYLAFPVALATSVFGIALRMRALAWTAGALAAVTVAVTLAYFVPRPGGLVLLSENKGTDQTARWFVQGGGGGGDPEAFRYLEQSIPPTATLALAVETNTYLYQAWDARLRRTVVFAAPDGRVPESAAWLVVGPGTNLVPARSAWTRAFASAGGWRIYRRA
jgi:Dolichyl-phosphate-mannose-protein mannosyltransferase